MSLKQPLFFYPILQERIWGGKRLQQKLNKPSTETKTGESWELSAIPSNVSVVRNGMFHGKSLLDLLVYHGNEVFGSEFVNKYGTRFPYLFKFIDAAEQLSIQVHPDDEMAQRKHQSAGKNEMWYIVDADANATLTIGFSKNTTIEEYQKHLTAGTLTDLLQQVPLKKGDAFYIPAGTIHAIGGGIVLAEIQQSSDITYRVYDFNRMDDHGKTRELHTEQALDVLDFTPIDAKIRLQKVANTEVTFVQNQHFDVKFITVENAMFFQKPQISCVWMCVEGSVSFEIEGEKFWFKAGETLVMPQLATDFLMIGRAKILSTLLV